MLSYRAWCAQMHELSTCAALRRLVTCFTKRFHQIGYPQGIDHLAMFLLGFMTEEEAFWTLCAIAEVSRDFLSNDFNWAFVCASRSFRFFRKSGIVITTVPRHLALLVQLFLLRL